MPSSTRLCVFSTALMPYLFAGFAPCQQPELYDEAVLRTFSLTFQQANWWQLMEGNRATETYIPADLMVDGVTYQGVGVRFKGNSSFNVGTSKKRPFKIKLDAFAPGQELYGYETINLNNSFRDPSFVREVLGYKIFRDYMPTPKANYVKLVINGENWGVYINAQQVNKDFLREWFKDDDGNRYKANAAHSQGSALNWLGSNPSYYAAKYELLTNNATPWLDLINVCKVLNGTHTSTLVGALEPIFNVDRSLWMLALDDALPNLDSYLGTGWNYILYRDGHHQRMQVLPWDLNECFGGYRNGLTLTRTYRLWPFYQAERPQFPLMSLLAVAPGARQAYLAHLRTIMTRHLDWSVLAPIANRYRNLIRAEVYADQKKLYSNAAFEDNLTQSVQISNIPFTGTISLAGIEPMIRGRRSYLAHHAAIQQPLPVISSVGHVPSQPLDTETVWVRADLSTSPMQLSSVELRWRETGAFNHDPMFDDGQHQDGLAGDGVYGAAIPPQQAMIEVEYCVVGKATSSAGGAWVFAPEFAEHRPLRYAVRPGPVFGTSVRINEFVAKNNSGIRDEANEFEDWIELTNTTIAAIDLSGMYLTDDVGAPTKWAIPAGNVLQPGESMLVWADNEPANGPLHATFKLGASGEEIGLFAPDGRTLLDHIAFGPQIADVATGRLFDGGNLIVTFASPTPRITNELVGCGQRSFSALDPTAHSVDLAFNGTVKVGGSAGIQVAGGQPVQPHFLVAAAIGANWAIPLTSVALLMGPPMFTVTSGLTDTNGAITWPLTVPNIPSLAGARLYFQVFGIGTSLQASNAVELVICP